MIPVKVDRRDFLKTSAVAGAGLVLGFYLPGRLQAAEPPAAWQPNAGIQIAPDEKVTLWVAKSEMGQGVRTSLPIILADELDCDWKNVSIEPAMLDPKYGRQGTGGSTSVRTSWAPLREAGAAAREMLLEAAAKRWGVTRTSCVAREGFVVHRSSKRKLSYGALVAEAAQLPVPASPHLKDPKDFRYIGKSLPRTDLPDKVRGRAQFGIDTRVPGMLYAALAQCPVFGGKAKAFECGAAMKIDGVKHVTQISDGIAVVADSYWAALKGRRSLTISWDEGPNASMSSDSIRRQFDELSQKPGIVQRQQGDPDKVLAAASRKIEAVYEVPCLAHACMEPMNCTADVRADSCVVWAPTQNPAGIRESAARITGLPPEKIQVHITLLGTGFGRRAALLDFASQAVEISKAVAAPVKLVWTREDDIQHDYYRPASFHRFAAALDDAGKPVLWTHRLVAPSISDYFFHNSTDGKAEDIVDGADAPYEFDHYRLDYHMARTGVPIGWWRSVYNSQNAFVSEAFFDEVAALAGKDPVELRLSLLGKESPQHRATLELAAEKAGWGKPALSGLTRGAAVHKSFGTCVAEIAEVSLEKNVPRVHRVVCVVDCGTVVDPDGVVAQMQSGIVYGLSAALKGEITIDKGRVQQDNFSDYPVIMLDEMPQVEVYILPSNLPPQGTGEPGLPPIAPAVANAIFAATKKPVRRLPIRNLGT